MVGGRAAPYAWEVAARPGDGGDAATAAAANEAAMPPAAAATACRSDGPTAAVCVDAFAVTAGVLVG